jgi:hypothetical protein
MLRALWFAALPPLLCAIAVSALALSAIQLNARFLRTTFDNWSG